MLDIKTCFTFHWESLFFARIYLGVIEIIIQDFNGQEQNNKKTQFTPLRVYIH